MREDNFFLDRKLQFSVRRSHAKSVKLVVSHGKMCLGLAAGGKVIFRLTPKEVKGILGSRNRMYQGPEEMGKPAIVRESYLFCITQPK